LTFIFGARCEDGVVLIADRKFTIDDGTDYVIAEKLEDLQDHKLVFGFAGDRGTFELFKVKMEEALKNEVKICVNQLILTISEVLSSLNNRFRLPFEKVEVLVAIGEEEHYALLKYFAPDGKPIPITTAKVIGNGAPYGMFILKTRWRGALTMKETAEMAYFVIRIIELDDLITSVGIGNRTPQIWFMPDGLNKKAYQASDALQHELKESVEAKVSHFHSQLAELFPD
jgi:20S proteasome alpha/beta subunit